jgi:hypothetical protein
MCKAVVRKIVVYKDPMGSLSAATDQGDQVFMHNIRNCRKFSKELSDTLLRMGRKHLYRNNCAIFKPSLIKQNEYKFREFDETDF